VSIKKRSQSPSDKLKNDNLKKINFKKFDFKRMKTMGGPIQRQKYSATAINRATTAQSGGFM
jgi:hypothetical protein